MIGASRYSGEISETGRRLWSVKPKTLKWKRLRWFRWNLVYIFCGLLISIYSNLRSLTVGEKVFKSVLSVLLLEETMIEAHVLLAHFFHHCSRWISILINSSFYKSSPIIFSLHINSKISTIAWNFPSHQNNKSIYSTVAHYRKVYFNSKESTVGTIEPSLMYSNETSLSQHRRYFVFSSLIQNFSNYLLL